jgi:hypothetical protein
VSDLSHLQDELKRVILGFVSSHPNPTLATCMTACRFVFSEAEVKTAIDELIDAHLLTVEGNLVVAGGELLAVVKLRPGAKSAVMAPLP